MAVVNLHTIKPLDRELVARYAAKCKNVFTAEEHSVIGGLGDAVADVLVGNGEFTFTKLGIEDQFGQSGKAMDVRAPTACAGIRLLSALLKSSDFPSKKKAAFAALRHSDRQEFSSCRSFFMDVWLFHRLHPQPHPQPPQLP